jgi:hypothetical protein
MNSDITKITQLVLHERQGRDRGWWDQIYLAIWMTESHQAVI